MADNSAPSKKIKLSVVIPAYNECGTIEQLLDKVIEAGRKTGTSLGRLVPDVDSGISLYKQGFDFIAYSADAWALGDAVAAGLSAIRAGCVE